MVLSFACAADSNATSIKYVLSGTDATTFALSSATAAVTVLEALTDTTQPAETVTVAMVAGDSNAGEVVVEGECPGMGASIIHFHPNDPEAVAMGSWDDV